MASIAHRGCQLAVDTSLTPHAAFRVRRTRSVSHAATLADAAERVVLLAGLHARRRTR
jgi:hypothetical protein